MNKAGKIIRDELGNGATRDRMVRVARSVLRDTQDSEDAAHDAVLQALNAADRYREDARASTWLHRITVNAALMKVRKHKRLQKNERAAQNEVVDATRDAAPAMSAPLPTPSRLLESKTDRLRVRNAIAQLPLPYREVMEQHVMNELAPQDVASQLGLTPSAVRTRIGRARRQLQVMLAVA